MGIGVMLGRAATTGLKTYRTLGEEIRDDAVEARAAEAAKRAAAAFGDAQSAKADEAAANAALAGELSSGVKVRSADEVIQSTTPVKDTGTAAPAERTAGLKMNLGGPNAAAAAASKLTGSAGPDPEYAAAQEAEETTRAKTALPAMKAGMQVADSGSKEVDAAMRVWQANPKNKTAKANYEKAIVTARENAETASKLQTDQVSRDFNRNAISISQRSADRADQEEKRHAAKFTQEMSSADLKLKGEKYLNSSKQLTTIGGELPDDDTLSVTDPKALSVSARAMWQLKDMHAHFQDGKRAEYEKKDGAYVVKFFDEETGKHIPDEDQTIKTVGDLRRVSTMALAVADPQNYATATANVFAARKGNELAEEKFTLEKKAVDLKGHELDLANRETTKKEEAMQLLEKFQAGLLENPYDENLVALAGQIHRLYPEKFTTKVGSESIKDPETGKTTTRYVSGNMLMEQLQPLQPREVVLAPGPDGKPRATPYQAGMSMLWEKVLSNKSLTSPEARGAEFNKALDMMYGKGASIKWGQKFIDEIAAQQRASGITPKSLGMPLRLPPGRSAMPVGQ